jgi:hypothetical protein
MAGAHGAPIMVAMNSPKTFRRYVLVGRREDERTGVRRLSLARLVGVVEIASTAPGPAKGGAAS